MHVSKMTVVLNILVPFMGTTTVDLIFISSSIFELLSRSVHMHNQILKMVMKWVEEIQYYISQLLRI